MVEAVAFVTIALADTLPVSAPLDLTLPLSTQGFSDNYWELVDLAHKDALPIPAWRSPVGPWAGSVSLLLPPQNRGGTLRLALSRSPKISSPFIFKDQEKQRLVLSEREAAVLAYNYGMVLPAGVPEDRRRSSYIHPLYGLDGELITDDFPQDHYHHRGIFWAWPYVTVGERKVDLWSLRGICTQFEQWLGQHVGSSCAVLGVQNGWYIGEERVLEEQAWFRVWRAGETGRAIDVHLTFEAQRAPLSLLGATGKGYGGLGLRTQTVADKTVTKSDGKTTNSSNEERVPWADLSARFPGPDRMSGVAIFIDAENPGFPNGWCLRDYGFLGVNWPGLESVTLEPGSPVTLKYRLWIHRGDVNTGQVAAAYQLFAHPPLVSVES
ncbi:MAG: PmoA family protein [Candidatus Zipacnadales bacterium]